MQVSTSQATALGHTLWRLQGDGRRPAGTRLCGSCGGMRAGQLGRGFVAAAASWAAASFRLRSSGIKNSGCWAVAVLMLCDIVVVGGGKNAGESSGRQPSLRSSFGKFAAAAVVRPAAWVAAPTKVSKAFKGTSPA
eukprot:365447-Chlamydomonas_euryale.AAC.4